MTSKRRLNVTPEAKRRHIYNQMPPELRQKADRIDNRLRAAAKGTLLIDYDNGVEVQDVLEQDSVYGHNAINLLEKYTGERSLHDLYLIARSFSREYVEEQAKIPMANGSPLTRYHFVELQKIKSAETRKTFLTRIRRECLSIRDLRREIQSTGEANSRNPGGGRKIKPPTSPKAGLRRLVTDTERLSRLVDVLDDAVFAEIGSMPAAKVTDDLPDKIEEAKEFALATIAKLRHAIERLDGCKDRVARVLELRDEAEEDSGDEDDESDEEKAAEDGTDEDEIDEHEGEQEEEGVALSA